jgi:glycerate kinase
MASAAGLRLVPRDQRNPLATTSYGVGELIRAALSVQPQRILIGCGDSGINDGGAGMAQALGVSLLDAHNHEIGRGCGALASLAWIDRDGLDRRLKGVQLDVACNPYNVLCGPNGVARVFGPQKGATPAMVEAMSAAMERYAQVIEQQFGVDMRDFPGGGASGGLGTGLQVLLGARLHSRYDVVMRYLRLDDLLQNADLVITAEGGIDGQTPRGKIPAEVARRAKRFGVPVIALAGTVGQGAHENYAHGIAAYTSVLQAPCTLEEAIQHAQRLTTEAAESAMRMVMVGRRLTHSHQRSNTTHWAALPSQTQTRQLR